MSAFQGVVVIILQNFANFSILVSVQNLVFGEKNVRLCDKVLM